jgi:hypothetical protein
VNAVKTTGALALRPTTGDSSKQAKAAPDWRLVHLFFIQRLNFFDSQL